MFLFVMRTRPKRLVSVDSVNTSGRSLGQCRASADFPNQANGMATDRQRCRMTKYNSNKAEKKKETASYNT